jgi:hypothetical protein
MYKGNSASLQRYHKVHEINVQPRTGAVEGDFIPTAANMSWEECEAEKRALVLEKTKMANELAAAKRCRDKSLVTLLGMRQQTYDGRLGLIRQRQDELKRGNQFEALRLAINEMLPEEQRKPIFARMSAIMDELCRGA